MTTPSRHSPAEPRNSSSNHALPVATAVALASCLLLAAISPARANLVTDPGFESCTAIGAAPPPGWSGNASCSLVPHSGTWDANFIVPAPAITLSQSIATTAGDMYDFSFWLFNRTPGSPNSFTASFGSDVVLNLTNAPFFLYTFEDFTVTAGAGTSTTISFASTGEVFWALDDVSVAAVPAPALSPLGPALVGLFLLARRAYRRRQA